MKCNVEIEKLKMLVIDGGISCLKSTDAIIY